jgi:hypothetical protein
MTIMYSRPVNGRTRFGIFHNVRCTVEETGYFMVHVFGAAFGVLWTR